MSIRWLSVPPDTSGTRLGEALGQRGALRTTWAAYSLNDGWAASWKATAFAAITCSSGPPCRPGNTALSMAAACSARHRMAPPRGPAASCGW